MKVFDLYYRVVRGDRRAAVDFQENMTRSDFSFLFGDIIDRELLATYAQLPVQWTQLAKPGRVRDFRRVKRFTLDGGESVLDEVPGQSEYPAASLAGGFNADQGRQFGRPIPRSSGGLLNAGPDA